MSEITMKRVQAALRGFELLNQKQHEILQFQAMFTNILRVEDMANLPELLYDAELPPDHFGPRRLQLRVRSTSRTERRVLLLISQLINGEETTCAAHPQGSLTRGLIIPIWEKLPEVLSALTEYVAAVRVELNFYEGVTQRVAELTR